MSSPPLSTDEAILTLLRDQGRATSARIAVELGVHERTARRRLRRLIRDGYVFSPERGTYRITAAGIEVMAPTPQAGPIEHDGQNSSLLDASPRDLMDRWLRR